MNTGNSGVMLHRLVAGDAFNVGNVLNDSANRMVERMIIECNTVGGGGAINIQMPTFAALQNIVNLEISIVDTGNNAGTNNIIITPGAGNTVNQGATFTINTNKGSAYLIGGTTADWSCFKGAGTSSSSGGGVGTVTSFSAGNLAPLFTTGVATATSTPALSFTITNQVKNTVLIGPITGADAAPTFRALTGNDIAPLYVKGVLDFPNTLEQKSSDLTIALIGAAVGDVVLLGVPIDAVLGDSCYTAFVSAADVVTVRFNNYKAGAQDPASATFTVAILKFT